MVHSIKLMESVLSIAQYKLTGDAIMKQILLGLLCFYAITVGFALH